MLADIETHEGMGRLANALEAVKEFQERGDSVKSIFDGAGVKWPVALSAPDHKLHGLYQSVAGSVIGVCKFCAGAFGVTDAALECKLPLLSEHEGHPSFRQLLADGYQVITF